MGQHTRRFLPFRESVYQHTLWLLLSWMTLSKEVMENHSEWVCLSIRMGIIIFLTSWGCGGNKWVHEKASSPGPGSITLQFILLLQKFPIMFSPWEQIVAVESLSRVQLFVIPWTAAYQASLVFRYLQVPMQYCSLQHQTLFSPSDTSTTEHRFRFGLAALFFLELLVIALCSSRSLLNTYWVSLKVHLGFSVRCHGKSWTNFLANPIVRREQNKMNALHEAV